MQRPIKTKQAMADQNKRGSGQSIQERQQPIDTREAAAHPNNDAAADRYERGSSRSIKERQWPIDKNDAAADR